MADSTPESVFRIGVRFEGLTSATQVLLDRYVFAQMQRRARARKRDGEGGTERRLTSRVEIPPSENLFLVLRPMAPVGVLSGTKQEPPQTFPVHDISTTGCSFVCSDPELFKPKQSVRLQLQSKNNTIDVELVARVIYVQPAAP